MRSKESVSYFKTHYRPAPVWVWILTVTLVGVFVLAASGFAVVSGFTDFL